MKRTITKIKLNDRPLIYTSSSYLIVNRKNRDVVILYLFFSLTNNTIIPKMIVYDKVYHQKLSNSLH